MEYAVHNNKKERQKFNDVSELTAKLIISIPSTAYFTYYYSLHPIMGAMARTLAGLTPPQFTLT
ncbi:MAG: hypothetical protein NTZ73_01950 [Candidatus Diapherotrites archaeon]|nr:hypothetical protein [Candidatus Diapherotrites archaeon]